MTIEDINNKDFVIQKVHKNWVKELRDIARERIKIGKDTLPKSIRRLSLAQTRAPEWEQLKKRMIEWDIPETNKKGNILATFGIFIGLILAITLGFVILLGSAIFTNMFSDVTTVLTTLPNQVNTSNISQYAVTTFGNIDGSFQQFKWIAILLIFGLFMGVLVSAYMVRSSPVYFVFYFLLMIAVVVFSIIISNSYEKLYTSAGVLGTSLGKYGGASWIYLYLPIWTTVFGFIGGIIVYLGIPKDAGGDI